MNKLIKTTSIIFFILFLGFVSIPKILADGSEKFTKSKSATGLDENFDTKITLLLNKSGENNNTIDLLFLTDIEIYNDVTGSNLVNEMYNMISNINSSDSIKATISLVLYGMDADKIIEYVDTKDITSKEDLVNRIEAKRDWINSNSFGSNMERALLLVKNMLASSPSNNNPEDRHIILLTNGNTLSYNNADGDSATTVFDGGSFYLDMSTMDSNGDAASANRETKMVKYYNETNDYGEAFAKLLEEKDAVNEYAMTANKWHNLNKATVDELKAQGKVKTFKSSDVADITKYPYTNLEIGAVQAAKVLLDLKEAKYNIYTIGYLYLYGWDDNGNPTAKLLAYPPIGFVKWTSNVGQLYLHEQKNVDSTAFNGFVNQIDSSLVSQEDDSFYLVDEMGYGQYKDGSDYNFDFVNDINKISINVDGTVLDKTKIDDNTYGFGKDSSIPGGYKYIFKYYPNGIDGVTNSECYKLDVNYNIEPNIPVKLEYHQVLNKNTRKNASELSQEEILKASNSTIIYLKNGQTESFENPVIEIKNTNEEIIYDGESKNIENPNTLDPIYLLLILLFLSILGLSGALIYSKYHL